MNIVLILTPAAEAYATLIAGHDLPDLKIHCAVDSVQARQFIERAAIILGDPGMIAELLNGARRLEWVQSIFAGVEPLCRPGLRTDYQLTGVKGVFGPMMSEYVFGHILALERHLLKTLANQRRKLWKKLPYRRLNRLTLGICGLGSIGRHLAGTARHFGMRVVGLSRSGAAVQGVEKVFSPSRLGPFLAEADYVVIALPDTRETRGMIDAAALQRMKPSAILINIGRGAAIKEPDLILALNQEWIAGAVLDVFRNEPLTSDNPLWDMGNVRITPHISGISFPEDVVPIFCDNYLRFIERQPLRFVIPFDRGY